MKPEPKKLSKNVNRIILLFFVSIFILGCGRSQTNTVMLWTTLRPIERDLLQQKINQFARNYPQYRFQMLYYETEELRTNFIIASLAGKGPEIVQGPSDNIGPFSDLGVILPLEDIFSRSFLDSFITEPFEANTWFKGHLYQIADRIGNQLTLVYNRDMIPTPPKTMNELIAMGQKIVKDTDGDGTTDIYALAWNYIEPYFVIPFIGGYGGWIVDDEFNPTLNTDAVIKAASFIYDLANKYKIIPRECDYETANALFLDRQVAMIINGPWSWATYIKAGLNIGLARIPKIDETGLWPTPMVSPKGYSVNANISKEKLNVVKQMIKFLTSDTLEEEFSKKFITIPSRKKALADSSLYESPLFKAALSQVMVGRTMPVNTELRWIWDAMRPAYQGIFTGRYSPEKAAVEMQKLAEKLIRENK